MGNNIFLWAYFLISLNSKAFADVIPTSIPLSERVTYADAQEASQLIGKNDEYVSHLSALNLALRAARPFNHSEFLSFLASQKFGTL